jgi:hypothetical protein
MIVARYGSQEYGKHNMNSAYYTGLMHLSLLYDSLYLISGTFFAQQEAVHN